MSGHKYLLVVNDDRVGAGEIVVVSLSRPILEVAGADEDGNYVETKEGKVYYFHAFTLTDIVELFKHPVD